MTPEQLAAWITAVEAWMQRVYDTSDHLRQREIGQPPLLSRIDPDGTINERRY